jgi:dTDP-4-amino-4,6-dideoxygalactose transaminase
MNLDPQKVEEAITPRTQAILPVHCYGRVCDVDRFAEIAKKHKLKLIYDAAHAFGVQDAGGSVLRYGNLSVLSFHATKVFTTFEGGAIISPSAETKRTIDHLKNFGFENELSVTEVGINGKMNEVQAAFGLLQLKHMDAILGRRKAIDAQYRSALKGHPGISVLEPQNNVTINGGYFPILIGDDFPMKRDALYEHLKKNNVYARRYFYPLISNMEMYRTLQSSARNNLLTANRISEQVLCLPIYPDLGIESFQAVVDFMKNC